MSNTTPVSQPLQETATHTPGPWHRGIAHGNPLLIFENAKDARLVASASIPHFTAHEREANARLIAAAPDLLEALQAVVDICDVDETNDRIVSASIRYLLPEMREAVAKATQP